MTAAVQLTPRCWQLKMNLVNCYLLETGDGLLLIDTGYPNSADKLFSAVRQAGHNPANIRHLLLTHCHIDHGGSAAEVRRRTGARTYAHVLDAPLVAQGIAERPGTARTPGVVNFFVHLFFIKYAGTTYEPMPVDHLLHHGEVLPLAGGIEVIHTPGHSAGHVCLLLVQENMLVAGDICSHVMGLSYSTLNEDITLAQQSILRAAAYSFDQAVFGHGDPLTGQANQQLNDKFAR